MYGWAGGFRGYTDRWVGDGAGWEVEGRGQYRVGRGVSRVLLGLEGGGGLVFGGMVGKTWVQDGRWRVGSAWVGGGNLVRG